MTNYINQVICGDCTEVMKGIKSKSVDLVLTDPPYNCRDIGPHHKKYESGVMQLSPQKYRKFCREWFRECQRISRRIVFTPGITNTHNYPQPTWQICWHKPAARSFNGLGGYNAWEPIFVYVEKPGSRINLGQDYILRNTLNFKKGIESGHPCPKILSLWTWLIEIFSTEGDIVLDPFLGSGTTAAACIRLNRRFIGIEISSAYVRIAEERIRIEQEKQYLFRR